MEKKRIDSFDFIKFFAILFVVCIHTKPFSGFMISETIDLNLLIDVFARFAVPFFFVTSGFLISQKTLAKDYATTEYFKKYISNILSILIAWMSFYFIYDVAIRLYSGIRDRDKTELENYLNGFFNLDTLLYSPNGTPYHLWYLVALIWSLIILYLFIRIQKPTLLLVVSFALHLFGLLGQSYSVFIDLDVNTRDALFFGVFYLTLGYWIGANLTRVQKYLLRVKPITYALLFFLFSITSIFERVLTKYYFGDGQGENYYLSTPFLVLSLFLFALTRPETGRGSWMAKVGERSLGIYVIHVVFINIVKRFSSETFIIVQESFWWHLLYTPSLFIISYFAYELIQFAKRKYRLN
ncbi:acyltransferase [Mesobacillus maritimus]|uniref:acyltransferase n=1 Tax=Mesobacillus maritimus TaxID=1643336 RepID=UPI00203FD5A6|nr:acyltransferase [Mesobacillus maritimus]MCM3668084.1 acyltransferase [Mesobacillus maritimus]